MYCNPIVTKLVSHPLALFLFHAHFSSHPIEVGDTYNHVQYQSGGNDTVVVRVSLLAYKNGDKIFTEKNQQAGVLYVHVHLHVYNLFTS